MADKRSFPAIDITKSGTRKEELLVSKEELAKNVGASAYSHADGCDRCDGFLE